MKNDAPLQFRSMTSALVTGASGFVGSHLCSRLVKEGVRVKALVRHESKGETLRREGVEVFVGDITQPHTLIPAVTGVDTVFHVAAALGPAHLPIKTSRKINAEGVKNMIDAARNAGSVQRFVHVSSVGVLGPLAPREVACEGTPPKPRDVYEISKLEGEEIALAAAREGFPVVIARPAWIYGPGDLRTLKLFRMIAKKRFLIVGKARNKQHPVWIEDVVEGLICCARVQGIEGRVYHLAGPEILRVETLCREIANALDVGIPSYRPPVWALKIPVMMVEGLFKMWRADPPVDHRKLDFFTINRAYSIKRARNELGWEPQTRFKDGLRRAVDWYRRHNML